MRLAYPNHQPIFVGNLFLRLRGVLSFSSCGMKSIPSLGLCEALRPSIRIGCFTAGKAIALRHQAYHSLNVMPGSMSCPPAARYPEGRLLWHQEIALGMVIDKALRSLAARVCPLTVLLDSSIGAPTETVAAIPAVQDVHSDPDWDA